ncbi:hypothetical protein BLNAU_13534 [Blattamonas nauphoetae]|uniref:Uncharacterized protein n=1 Tax=Blattamonas nauphoetae TaxID=2049346 RepID=A0ABQ9XJE4_9EUKA|nr:hypothetical protein BLNAU_13534 [Blattamonas nauphoetae]
MELAGSSDNQVFTIYFLLSTSSDISMSHKNRIGEDRAETTKRRREEESGTGQHQHDALVDLSSPLPVLRSPLVFDVPFQNPLQRSVEVCDWYTTLSDVDSNAMPRQRHNARDKAGRLRVLSLPTQSLLLDPPNLENEIWCNSSEHSFGDLTQTLFKESSTQLDGEHSSLDQRLSSRDGRLWNVGKTVQLPLFGIESGRLHHKLTFRRKDILGGHRQKKITVKPPRDQAENIQIKEFNNPSVSRRAVSLRLSTKLNIKPDTKTRFQTPSMILEQVMVGVKKGERVAPDDGRIRLKADSGGMRRKESHSRR